NLIPQALKEGCGQWPDVLVVVDNQDSSVMPTQGNLMGFRGTRDRNSSRAWQVHLNCGALSNLGIYRDSATGLLGNPINLAQSQARAATYRFCREERFKGLPQNLVGHAGPGIADRNTHVVARCQFSRLVSVTVGHVG